MANSSVQLSESADQVESANLLSDRERALRISAVIRGAERRLRHRYPILSRQDLLGSLIFVFAVVGFVATTALYIQGLIPAWTCVVLNALFTSLLHELEHDLIHHLYFRDRPLLHNAMMLGAWAFRGNTINPWYRRHLHLLHHKDSGQQTDLEERLIGLGMKYGFLRLLSTFDGLAGSLVRYRELSKIPACQPMGLFRSGLPMMLFFWLIWYSWLLYHGVSVLGAMLGLTFEQPAWLASLVPILNSAVVVYALPNILRQASINIISSSMHYYDDVDGLMQQTQVFNTWLLWPVQVFCFNFGGTHGIHHFVVSQPFYLRQMVARPAHAAMKKYGVRFNDTGTFKRANRYSAAVGPSA